MSAKKIMQLIFLSVVCLSFVNVSGNRSQSLTNEIDPMLKNLQPEPLWYYFDRLCKIPRASGHEQALADYILTIAAENGLQGVQDSAGNVIVKKPASSMAYQAALIVVLQSHMDMVTEKNKDIEHDFSTDPINLVRSGKYISAAGTTLGADNGIGVASMLAIMIASDLAHGPLEFLFTVEEESGFGGARNVTPQTVAGRIFVNLDSERHGSVVVGCAGGCVVSGEMPITYEQAPEDFQFFQIALEGLKGGHSGADIAHGRAHAIKILAQFLELVQTYQGRLISVSGGNKHNAIPRDAQAVIALPVQEVSEFKAAFDQLSQAIKNSYASIEPGMVINLVAATSAFGVLVMQEDYQRALIKLLTIIPQGVIRMSSDIDGLVETSTHLARIETTRDGVKILTSQRSLIEQEKQKIVQTVVDALQSAGMQTMVSVGYPGWRPNLDSPILQITQATYQKLFNQKAIVKAIHAGLECGEIGRTIPDMDMISFGPTIRNAHSPSEYVDVDTVEPFWIFLTTLLQDLAEQQITIVDKQCAKRLN